MSFTVTLGSVRCLRAVCCSTVTEIVQDLLSTVTERWKNFPLNDK